MSKLTITIREKTEKISDDQSLTGYETSMELEPEGHNESPLSILGPIIYETISKLMSLYHDGNPAADIQISKDQNFCLETAMAAEIAKFQENPFPSQL
jgi:hypothetical protein